MVDLVVVDDGPGIPPTERLVIASGGESALDHSSGLGLWLVDWVVTRSGGAVAITDRSPGTTVVLRFPATDPPQSAIGDEDERVDRAMAR